MNSLLPVQFVSFKLKFCVRLPMWQCAVCLCLSVCLSHSHCIGMYAVRISSAVRLLCCWMKSALKLFNEIVSGFVFIFWSELVIIFIFCLWFFRAFALNDASIYQERERERAARPVYLCIFIFVAIGKRQMNRKSSYKCHLMLSVVP